MGTWASCRRREPVGDHPGRSAARAAEQLEPLCRSGGETPAISSATIRGVRNAGNGSSPSRSTQCPCIQRQATSEIDQVGSRVAMDHHHGGGVRRARRRPARAGDRERPGIARGDPPGRIDQCRPHGASSPGRLPPSRWNHTRAGGTGRRSAAGACTGPELWYRMYPHTAPPDGGTRNPWAGDARGRSPNSRPTNAHRRR